MCGVDFTVYDLIPAGAAWMRAVWVRHANPRPVDGAGGRARSLAPESVEAQSVEAVSVEAQSSEAVSVAAESVLARSALRVASLGHPVGDHAVHAEIKRVPELVGCDDPGVDREPVFAGR
jgi:hypothetical protein